MAAMLTVAPAWAALGRATADFDNARPNKGETAFGRLTADSIKSAAGADAAVVYAGALKAGTLQAGDIEQIELDALLKYGDDEVVTVTVTGAQLREAFERAVREYPTGDDAFLHASGLTVVFNGTGGPPRVVTLKVNGRDVAPTDIIRLAMTASLANDTYFKVFNGLRSLQANVKLRGALANHISRLKTISPDNTPRVSAR